MTCLVLHFIRYKNFHKKTSLGRNLDHCLFLKREGKKAKFQSLKEAFDTGDNQASIYQTMDPRNCTTYQYQCCQLFTVWKCHTFSIRSILLEIKLGDSRCAKCAISTDLEAIDDDFYQYSYFLKAEIYQNCKFRAPKIVKNSSLRTSKFS